MANSAKTVTVKVTAQKGTATKSETITIVVGAKSQVGGPISDGGNPSTGKQPVSGGNSTPQTGIDINKPSDDNS